MEKSAVVHREDRDRWPALAAGYMVLLLVLSALMDERVGAAIILLRLVMQLCNQHRLMLQSLTVDCLLIITAALVQFAFQQLGSNRNPDSILALMTAATVVGTVLPKALLLDRLFKTLWNGRMQRPPETCPSQPTPFVRISF